MERPIGLLRPGTGQGGGRVQLRRKSPQAGAQELCQPGRAAGIGTGMPIGVAIWRSFKSRVTYEYLVRSSIIAVETAEGCHGAFPCWAHSSLQAGWLATVLSVQPLRR